MDFKKEIDYYAVLNVPRDATPEQIALAYRKNAIRCHPHRDPNSDVNALNPPEGIDDESPLPALPLCAQWAYINKAYDVLSNPLRREIYNRYGEAGLQKGVPLAHGYFQPYFYHGDYFQTYKEVFGTYSPYANIIDANINPPPLYSTEKGVGVKDKDKPVEKLLYLELKEIYFGAIKRMKILRREFIEENRTETEIREKILTIPIAPGTMPGTKMTFKEEGDQNPTTIPADIIFITADKPHEVFYRKGSDLHMDYEISLKQALIGFRLNITTIDNRKINMSIFDVIQPNDMKKIPGEGLPKPHETEKGDLYVHFDVKFPKFISRDMKVQVADIMNAITNFNKKIEEEEKSGPYRRKINEDYMQNEAE